MPKFYIIYIKNYTIHTKVFVPIRTVHPSSDNIDLVYFCSVDFPVSLFFFSFSPTK